MRGKLRWLWMASVVSIFLGAVCAAQAADRTDRSFGGDGFVKDWVGPVVDPGPLAPNIWDLAEHRGGFVGSLADLSAEQEYFGAVRYRHNGSIDRGFGRDGFTRPIGRERFGRTQAQGIAVQRDGGVVVVGWRHRPFAPAAPLLVRYRRDGSFDRSFGHRGIVTQRPNERRGGDVLHDVAIEPNGRIVAVGARGERGFGQSNGHPSGLVVAYRSDGRLDHSFGKDGRVLFPAPGGHGEYTGLKSVEALGDGRLLVAGYHFGSLFVARLLPDGRLDRSFGGGDGKLVMFPNPHGRGDGCPGICWSAAPFVLRPDGRILVIAATWPDAPVLLRLTPDGEVDRSFGRRGLVSVFPKGHYFQPFDLALQGRRIVVAGFDEWYDGKGDEGLEYTVLRLLGNGSLDRGFGRRGIVVRREGPFSGAYAILNQGKRVVVAGGGEDQRKEGDKWYSSFLLLTRYLPG
jgi:uncharacterized delta-60 repeat protein